MVKAATLPQLLYPSETHIAVKDNESDEVMQQMQVNYDTTVVSRASRDRRWWVTS